MILTKNTITDIILTGTVSNSVFADTFIEYVKENYGITIVACYCDTSKTVVFPKKMKKTDKISSVDLKWANNLHLDVFIRNRLLTDENMKKNLLEAFDYCVRSSGSSIEYPRSFLPEEIEYYGWNTKRCSEWDFSKVVEPCGTPIERKDVCVESFDGYVIWHCMSNSQKRLHSLKSISSIYGKVYCGWDESVKSMNLYIVVPECYLKTIDDNIKQKIADDCLSVLSSNDKFDIIRHIKLQPRYTTWSSLPNDIKFSFSRG